MQNFQINLKIIKPPNCGLQIRYHKNMHIHYEETGFLIIYLIFAVFFLTNYQIWKVVNFVIYFGLHTFIYDDHWVEYLTFKKNKSLDVTNCNF